MLSLFENNGLSILQWICMQKLDKKKLCIEDIIKLMKDDMYLSNTESKTKALKEPVKDQN